MNMAVPLNLDSCVHHLFFFRQEKEGLLTEAVKSFKGALGLDEKLQSAKEHVEKIQRQIKLMEEVGSVLLLLLILSWLITVN